MAVQEHWKTFLADLDATAEAPALPKGEEIAARNHKEAATACRREQCGRGPGASWRR